MNVCEIAKKLSLEPVTEIYSEDFRGVYAGDFLSRAMSRIEEGNLWVTIMNNINVVAVASLTEASAVILCEGVKLFPDAFEAAREKEVTVFETPLSAYDLCCRLYEAQKETL